MSNQSAAKTLVLGVGNPIRGDDGVGPAVVEQLGRTLDSRYFDCVCFAGAGLDLLPELEGYDRVVIIDSLVSNGLGEGECCELSLPQDIADVPSDQPLHNIGILDAIRLARRMNLPVPREIRLYGIGIRGAREFRDGLSETILSRLPTIVCDIQRDLCPSRDDGEFQR